MARSQIPNALAMRALKFGTTDPSEVLEVAETLRAAGRRAEAILLFERWPEHEFLRGERDWAAGEGQGFHLVSLRRMGCAVDEGHLRSCAEAAEARGRWMDARRCWLELRDEAAVLRIAEHLPPSLRPAAAPEADGD
jgi:hypothetical protein